MIGVQLTFTVLPQVLILNSQTNSVERATSAALSLRVGTALCDVIARVAVRDDGQVVYPEMMLISLKDTVGEPTDAMLRPCPTPKSTASFK